MISHSDFDAIALKVDVKLRLLFRRVVWEESLKVGRTSEYMTANKQASFAWTCEQLPVIYLG